jgi:hypothetical protein
VYWVVSSTSSLVAAEIPAAAANSQRPVAIVNGQLSILSPYPVA